MSLKHNLRLRRERETVNTLHSFETLRTTLQDTRVKGRKQQRSRNEKLDRLQRNLTDTQSGRARGEMTYFPGNLFDRPDMFIG